ncbi:MAG: Spy/CpxP family protein refolding chaperone [Bryobacterales bacterium]|nr:Spy/CpxP family protein refolding chaperone [Bryobacterales bacterium]
MNKANLSVLGLAVAMLLWQLAARVGTAPSGTAGNATVDVLARELRLSPDQSRRIDSILNDAREAAGPVQSELRQVREKLIQALREDRGQEEIERLEEHQASAYTHMASLESSVLIRIFSLLDERQKARAGNVFGRIGSLVVQGGSGPSGASAGNGRQRPAAPVERRYVI